MRFDYLIKDIIDLQEFASLFAGISLPVALKHRLESNLTKPEGDVEAKWVHRQGCSFHSQFV
jgi:hypothetical protein